MNSSSSADDVDSASAENKEEAKGNMRVLSIQSHVVSGYVGNKAAVFPLQLLGFDVDIINCVQFSNHTGYPFGWEGEVLDGTMLTKLVDGMDRNGLLSGDSESEGVGHILTGYIGSESVLRAVASAVQKLKGVKATCRYICDPVLGDNGSLYVPKELVDIYRRNVVPLADVITPNHFEAEQLTGISIKTIPDAQRACSILHDLGVSLVLITSIIFTEESGDCNIELVPPSNDSIAIFASRRNVHRSSKRNENLYRPSIQDDSKSDRTHDQYIIYTPRLAGHFTGTGDVCAALFLGWTADNDHGGENVGSCLSCTLEKLAGVMQAIVKRTADAAERKQSSSSSIGEVKVVSCRELQLIQSRDDILNPPKKFRAMRVN
mmetsp:Transcript_22340/g.47068  ORF Transcript_22340/g.47068 Transcript_22340/m.47068 type:complete len:376 (-) Transcript_22340:21-1148(-)|eukprot:CAMPEP_0183730754 /NCGR_PEP_ID=MMETSP0737-20130205/33614_1 /TAXON_ID=385413 /ORGANISM="Thalassiosira miniscula, Strain CCMP1093" /LENGTH=375 /DNA_ID=CAMNT_0025963333 /DNA_START=408 /DNA_END=1535 /DNA_ORIENTATION=+